MTWIENEREWYEFAVWCWVGIIVLMLVGTCSITAPYGRFFRDGFGPSIPASYGWLIMESPAVFVFIAVYLHGAKRSDTVPLVFLALFQIHYIHRALIYPFRRRNAAKQMPVFVVLLAVMFNTYNSYLQARWISHFGQYPDSTWLADPRFVIGLGMFLGGMLVNIHSDYALIRLRQSPSPNSSPAKASSSSGSDSVYEIPRGGLFEYVTCPNYLGEMIEWGGWAMTTWSFAGFTFFAATMANLLPRAGSNHRWIKKKLPNYPVNRTAVIPSFHSFSDDGRWIRLPIAVHPLPRASK